MRPVYIIICLFMFAACKNKKTYEYYQISSNTCNNCSKVEISLPKLNDKSATHINANNALRDEIILLLNYDDEQNVTTIDDAITSFTNGFENLKKMYPNESMTWEADINTTVSYENEKILSVKLDAYIFTGGAHGYKVTRFINFDKITGKELDIFELFKDYQVFEKFAETKFRIQEKIETKNPINSTGFMFEDDIFYLPENIGFTETGLILWYNQYEIASYADGPIELVFSFEEAEKYSPYLK